MLRQNRNRGFFNWFSLALSLLALVLVQACASLPKKELQEADEAIAAAEATEAERFAPAEWNAAVSTKAEAEQLVNVGEFGDARDKAVAATAAAKTAVDVADKNRTIFEENERLRQEEEARKAEEEARLQAEREAAEAAAAQDPFAFEEEDGADPFASEFEDFPSEDEAAAGGAGAEAGAVEEEAFAFEEETIAEPEPEPEPVVAEPEPEPMPASPYTGESRPYQVQRYDTLAKIAARADVYGDGDLWYIIYDANRDIIKDPDLLPRVEIMIPTSPSEAQKEEARRINENHVPNLWDGM